MKLTDRLEGAVAGAIAMTVLGQIPPFTALPEEIVSLPVGAGLGALLGAKKIKRMLHI